MTSQYLSEVFSNHCLLLDTNFLQPMAKFSLVAAASFSVSLLNLTTIKFSFHPSSLKHYDITRFLEFLMRCLLDGRTCKREEFVM